MTSLFFSMITAKQHKRTFSLSLVLVIGTGFHLWLGEDMVIFGMLVVSEERRLRG